MRLFRDLSVQIGKWVDSQVFNGNGVEDLCDSEKVVNVIGKFLTPASRLRCKHSRILFIKSMVCQHQDISFVCKLLID